MVPPHLFESHHDTYESYFFADTYYAPSLLVLSDQFPISISPFMDSILVFVDLILGFVCTQELFTHGNRYDATNSCCCEMIIRPDQRARGNVKVHRAMKQI